MKKKQLTSNSIQSTLKLSLQVQIAYYRVSTKRQEKSGLGLSAQQTLVKNFLGRIPDEEFIETETGKKSDRQELKKAIKRAKELDGRLVIAKLDRLSRNVHFISGLMESKVDFVCCDNPTATPFTLHILAAVAEQETKMISDRTKAALAEKKKKGIRLGAPIGKSGFSKERKPKRGTISAKQIIENRLLSIKKRYEESPANKLILELRRQGQTIAQIRDTMNNSGFKATMGGDWNNVQIWRVINRGEKYEIFVKESNEQNSESQGVQNKEN